MHLPTDASCLNQEIYFSVLQRKAGTPVDLADLDACILAFQDRYNINATPFDRTFTRTDLRDLLDRIGPPEQTTAPTTAAMTPDELTNSTTGRRTDPLAARTAQPGERIVIEVDGPSPVQLSPEPVNVSAARQHRREIRVTNA